MIAILIIVLIALVLVALYFRVIPNQLFRQSTTHSAETIDDKYHTQRILKQKELDRLLDKISKHGLGSLSKKERERLEELSK
jgi:hypothetical protein